MAHHQGIVVCFMIIFLDVAGGILSFSVHVTDKCNGRRHERVTKGLVAVGLSALAHMIANFNTCFSISFMKIMEKSTFTRRFIFISMVFSWCVVAIGLSAMIIGTTASYKSRSFCGMASHDMLIGGICCFVHGFINSIWCCILIIHNSNK